MQYSRPFPGKAKVYYEDLKAAKLCGSRFDLHKKIATGKIRKPYKAGPHQQSPAWWYPDEIEEDVERERAELSGKQSEAA